MGPTKIFTSVAIRVDKDLDLNGKAAKNAQDADQAHELVTLQQLNDLGGIHSDYGLIGEQNGVNKIFKTRSEIGFKSGSAMLYLNGVRQFKGDDYIELDNFYIELSTPPRPTAKLIMDYYLNK